MASLSVDGKQSVMNYVIINVSSDGTTYTIQSGDNGCNAVNGSGCTHIYYVLGNGTNVTVGVIDNPVYPQMPIYSCMHHWPFLSGPFLSSSAGLLIVGI